MSHYVRLLVLIAVLLPPAQAGLAGGDVRLANGPHPSLLQAVSLNAPRKPP